MDDKTIHNIQHKLDSIKVVMNDNIQFALQNTNRIDNIEQKSDLLADSSNTFNVNANKLKQAMYLKYWKFTFIIITIIIIIIIIISI